MPKKIHRFLIPRSARHSLELDTVHGNHKWRDAMAKEIGTMRDFKVFEPIHKDKILTRKDGWQYAPLHWVFAVKHDLRHKARLVIEGHVRNDHR